MKNPNIAAPIAMYNTLNLMDQTAIKISQAKNNLAEARKELASKKLLREYYISKASPSGFKIEAPWTENKPLDAYLTGLSKIKSSEVTAFPNGINPHGFEIDTVDRDRLWIYNDNEIWSTGLVKSFGYVYKGGNILTIYNEPNAHKYLEVDGKGDGFECGSLTYKNGNWKFVVTAEDAKPGYGDVEQEASWLDKLQTVLDWLGFYPVYGDFIDAVNAVIYFIRGKWFDGILSLLAVIPLIGSALKASVKSIYKGVGIAKLTRKVQKAWKSKDSTAIFQDLISSGAIHSGNFHLLGKGLDSLNGMIKSGNRFTKKIPGIKNSDAVIKQLDDLEVFMKNANIEMLMKNADDVTSVGGAVIRGGKRGAAGQIGSGVNALSDAEKIIEKSSRSIAKKLTLNILPLFKSFTSLNPKALKNLNRALDQRFTRELADPDKLAALIKTSTNKTQFDALDDILEVHNGIRVGASNASDLAAQLRSLPQSTIDAMARDMGDVITKMPGTHMMHNAYKNDTLVNLKAYTSKDMKDPVSAWYKQFNFQYKKNIDIIWNEIHDVGEDVGIESRPGVDSFESKVDEADGVVWPLAKKMLATVMGQQNYDSTKEIANNFKDSPIVQALVVQLSDKSRIAYDVEKAKGGSYE
jgi:hypothetical protein